jgi:hypothetical protein
VITTQCKRPQKLRLPNLMSGASSGTLEAIPNVGAISGKHKLNRLFQDRIRLFFKIGAIHPFLICFLLSVPGH